MADRIDRTSAAPLQRLTPRERDVALRLVRGLPDKAIALELGLSHWTVKQYVGQILIKAAAANRTQAAMVLTGG